MDGCWVKWENTRRYINIVHVVSDIDPNLVDALPGFHVFTGADYTPCNMNKGKFNPLKIIMKTPEFVTAFPELGCSGVVIQYVRNSLDSITCSVYSRSKQHVSMSERFV